MAFFVYDDITSVKPQFEKRFLLQISSEDAPKINRTKRTIVTENGEGRLVLTCLTEDVYLNPLGGRAQKYSASESSNYLINGYQLVPKSESADDGHWGRVEIIYTRSEPEASFMNVIYVTDRGNENEAKVTDLSKSNGVKGGVFNESVVAIFATSRERATAELTCKTRGGDSMSYYVSGVAAGKWNVTVDGKDYGTHTATEEGGLLTFTAPQGVVKITPAK